MFGRIKLISAYFIELNVNSLINSILSDDSFSEFILDLIRKDQLMEGVDGLGVSLGEYSFNTPTSSKTYEGKTASKGKGNKVILLDTSDFYDSGKIDLLPKQFNILFDTEKDDKDLSEVYGQAITYLSDEHLEIVKNSLRVKILQEIKTNIPK